MVLRIVERGGIYLANLNPNKGQEPGKVRPVIVIQADALNDVDHPTVIVVPLTSRLLSGAYPLRCLIKARGALDCDSDALCDQLRAISRQRISSEKIAALTQQEMLELGGCINLILDF